MKLRSNFKKLLYYIFSVAIGLFVIFSLYYVSLPEKYTLNIGDASPYDINATRSAIDMKATVARANEAAAQVDDVLVENPDVLIESVNSINFLFQNARTIREEFYATPPEENQEINEDETQEFIPITIEEASNSLKENVLVQTGIQIDVQISQEIILLEEPAFDIFYDNTISITNSILSYPVSMQVVNGQIQNNINSLEQRLDFYEDKIFIVERILNLFIDSNIEYDSQATNSARTLAYNTVIENPVMIPRGARIVSFGETITPNTYELLNQMDLLETDEFDFPFLGGISMFVLIILGIIFIYAKKYESDNIKSTKDRLSILIAMLLPFLLSLLVFNLSNLAMPVYIAAVLITAYYGFRTGVVMASMLTFLLLPVANFEAKFIIVSILGSIIAALFTLGISKRNNYALIIISTTMTCFLTTVAINIILRTPIRDNLIDSSFAVLSGSVSVIAALGIMPLFEMIFNSVSPLRLIELSQPGNPLLRRLFIEAPGTSQHSVMVGNLAEAGAQAIGANALVSRVGAYYHDIGKLENPEMFTENQSGENPHDQLSAKESGEIILAHPESGLRIAKKYKLPEIICKMIYEHHGSSKQAYFYYKACEYAKENNLPEPDINDYKYKTAKPSTKESGIIMLADTVEAAIKSTGINDLEDARIFIRKLVRQKVEEEQLVESDLSFKDVEELISAFLNIYSGHFRTRVRYPDAPRNTEQPKKI